MRLFFIVSIVGASTIDLLNRIPTGILIPLEQLYQAGIKHYQAQDFVKAIDVFEKSLVNYRMREVLETNCRVRCEENASKYNIKSLITSSG